jgi:hypothetical protein
MTLTKWLENGWLRRHRTSREEIYDLLGIADRDLSDAKSTISADWRFGIAYNAALKLCTILLYAEGYQAEKTLQHYRTIMALPLIIGPQRKKDADYLNACRAKLKIGQKIETKPIEHLNPDKMHYCTGVPLLSLNAGASPSFFFQLANVEGKM